MRHVRISGTGITLPGHEVTSAELEKRLSLANGWIVRKTGIRTRRHSSGPKESAACLGAEAARRALNEAGRRLKEVDLLVAAAGTMQQPIPCNAASILHALNPESGHGIGAFDVNATCLGFIQALDLAASHLTAGRAQRILIVCSDVASSGLDWSDKESCVLFGDGAAAVLVERCNPGEGITVSATAFKTYPEGFGACQVEGGGTSLPGHAFTAKEKHRYLFQMDGAGLHKIASKTLPLLLEELLSEAGLTVRELDLIIPHQAGELPLRLVSRRLGFPWEKVVMILGEVGNCIAASIPMALHHARTTGRWTPGSNVLLLGTSAGFSVGGMILRVQS